MRYQVADCGLSSERHIGLLPSGRREPRHSAGAEDRATTWGEPGIAEIGAMVGGLIRQGHPLPVVLTTLCQLFDATVEGFSSSVLLLDRAGERVRHAAGPATGPRLHEVWPILSLTGEPLGIFAVHQRKANPDITRRYSALIPQFIHVASAAIERMRSDEALERSAKLLESTHQLSSTCCFSWRVDADEISWSKELCQLFELDPPDVPLTLELIGARIHSDDLPSFRAMIERARSGVSDFEFEHRLRLPGNSIKYLHVVAHGARDQEGQLEYIGAVQDVTYRRHTEEALAKLRSVIVGGSWWSEPNETKRIVCD
jgi:PAS domain-containing protein